MITSVKSLDVRFKAPLLSPQHPPAKVALLVTNEYEGIFRNGGIGTHYRTLSEQLTADGWYVILLLTHADQGFGGCSPVPTVKHVFSAREAEDVLTLQPLHRQMMSRGSRDFFDEESVRCLLFAQATVARFGDALVYMEFHEGMGAAYRTIQAKRVGLLGGRSLIGLTMHGGHEWIFEANERYVLDNPHWVWPLFHYESFSFESADLVFYPSRFLRGKVEGYGWGTGHAVHMPYFVPVLDGGGARREDLPAVEVGRIPVVFFGRLEERKGLCTFVEALQSLGPEVCQGLHVLFVGKVVPLYSAPLRHLDSRQYLEGALGREVTFSIVADLYSEEALRYVGGLKNPVVCLTSPQENFPNSALEMGQLAVNLVVSDTGGFRETLELVQRAAGVYWFEPKNPRALAGAIARAIADGLEEPQVMDRQEVRRLNEALLTRKLQHIHEAFARAPGVAAGQPRVTVGVIWDDQHTALIECLGSLEGQSYGDFEVIILDNACTTRPARDTFEQARALFPQYRFVRSRALSAGAARNHLVELAEGAFFLGLDPDGILLPFAIEQFVKAARQSAAVLVACPRREGPSGQVTGFPEGPLPSLLLSPPPGPACLLAAVAFLRDSPHLEDYDGQTGGWELLAAAMATGQPVVCYPYPLYHGGAMAEPDSEAVRLKRQFQLRSYVAQIPPARWSTRQLHMLLMATQHLQAQVQSHATASPDAGAPREGLLQEEEDELGRARTELARVQAEVHDARGRITAMESTKFWKLRRIWFRLKRTLHVPGLE